MLLCYIIIKFDQRFYYFDGLCDAAFSQNCLYVVKATAEFA